MSAAVIESPPRAPVDRVRLIRRSIRCFLFGLVGAIPCAGLGMVWLAFKLYRDIAAETREPVKIYPLFLTSFSGLYVGVACCANHLPDGVLADAVVALGLQIMFIRQQYRKNEAAEWNPARHLMYWGMALANAGLIFSAALVILAIYMANHS